MNLIFDIGANHGQFSDQMISLYPNAQIVVVEANPSLHHNLTAKYQLNPNITTLNRAVSTEHGEELPFYVCLSADTISTADLDWIKHSRFSNHVYDKPILLQTTNLDNLISAYGIPDLIKVDVEGYELPVIKGLSSQVDTLCFEWAEEKYHQINETVAHLQNLGYVKFAFTIGDAYTLQHNYSTWTDCPIHADIDVDRRERWGMIWTTKGIS